MKLTTSLTYNIEGKDACRYTVILNNQYMRVQKRLKDFVMGVNSRPWRI